MPLTSIGNVISEDIKYMSQRVKSRQHTRITKRVIDSDDDDDVDDRRGFDATTAAAAGEPSSSTTKAADYLDKFLTNKAEAIKSASDVVVAAGYVKTSSIVITKSAPKKLRLLPPPQSSESLEEVEPSDTCKNLEDVDQLLLASRHATTRLRPSRKAARNYHDEDKENVYRFNAIGEDDAKDAPYRPGGRVAMRTRKASDASKSKGGNKTASTTASTSTHRSRPSRSKKAEAEAEQRLREEEELRRMTEEIEAIKDYQLVIEIVHHD